MCMGTTRSVSAEEARKTLADLLNGTQFQGEHVRVTRHGRTAGVLVPPDWYERATAALAEQGETE